VSRPNQTKNNVNRRRFLQTSAAGAAALGLSTVPFVHAGGGDTLRVGLVGCGGRGTGAAAQALRADRNVRLVAMGDAFRDKIEASLRGLQRDAGISERVDVPPERRFAGFDAYQDVIRACDVVLLCSPPGFRPSHIEAAVRAGKHIFAEKPVAVDGPGVRRVLAACQEAQRRRLAVASGFCWRKHAGMRQVVERVHDGAVGNIVALQCTYNTGTLWHRVREEGMSDMEWQVRNWLYFTWLSGDFNVEQHCHSLDKMAWVMRNQYPVRCYGTGGRQVRTGPEFGHIYDHMAVTYEFENGIKCFAMCRQQAGTANDVSDYVFGTQGTAVLSHSRAAQGFRVTGQNAWAAAAAQRDDDMYQREHNELFAGIRSGNPVFDGEWMAKSSLMAIMGRMACYTGRVIEWRQALESRQDLMPARLEMNAELPVPEVARPGVTTFS
jgi:myo-inositol 2-dehydrogenase / D-chiro-inositol 1-dehydrogenase